MSGGGSGSGREETERGREKVSGGGGRGKKNRGEVGEEMQGDAGKGVTLQYTQQHREENGVGEGRGRSGEKERRGGEWRREDGVQNTEALKTKKKERKS